MPRHFTDTAWAAFTRPDRPEPTQAEADAESRAYFEKARAESRMVRARAEAFAEGRRFSLTRADGSPQGSVRQAQQVAA